ADVQAAALPAAGVRLQPEVDAREVRGAHHAVPAHADRVKPVDQLAAGEEEDAPLPAQAADRGQVVAEAAGELDEAQAHQAGAAVQGGADVVNGHPVP